MRGIQDVLVRSPLQKNELNNGVIELYMDNLEPLWAVLVSSQSVIAETGQTRIAWNWIECTPQSGGRWQILTDDGTVTGSLQGRSGGYQANPAFEYQAVATDAPNPPWIPTAQAGDVVYLRPGRGQVNAEYQWGYEYDFTSPLHSGVSVQINDGAGPYVGNLGPEPIIDFNRTNQTVTNTPATNVLGQNIILTGVDDPTNTRNKVTFDPLGIFGVSNSDYSYTQGARRRIDLIAGSGITIDEVADDETNDTLHWTITNSGSTAMLTATNINLDTTAAAVTSPITPWTYLDAASDLINFRQPAVADSHAILDLAQGPIYGPNLLMCFHDTIRPSWAAIAGGPFGAGAATTYGISWTTTDPIGNGWPAAPTAGGPVTPGILNSAVSLIAYTTPNPGFIYDLWGDVGGVGGPFFGTYFNTGYNITLGSVGTYLIWFRYSAVMSMSVLPSGTICQILTRLYDNVAGAYLVSGANVVENCPVCFYSNSPAPPPSGDVAQFGSDILMASITTTQVNTVVSLYATIANVLNTGTVTDAQIPCGNNSGETCEAMAIRIY